MLGDSALVPGRFVSLRRGARELGVPLGWVREQVRRRQFPFLTIGRRTLIDVCLLRDALRSRALAQLGSSNGESLEQLDERKNI